MRATASPFAGRCPRNNSLPSSVIRHDRLPANLIQGDLLSRMLCGCGNDDGAFERSGWAVSQSKACIPPMEPPVTESSRSILRWSNRCFCTCTISEIVMMGKSRPYLLPVLGLIEDGPVVPLQPPRMFEQITSTSSCQRPCLVRSCRPTIRVSPPPYENLRHGHPRQRVKNKDGIRSVSVQFAIRLVGNGDGAQFLAALQGKLVRGKGKLISAGFHVATLLGSSEFGWCSGLPIGCSCPCVTLPVSSGSNCDAIMCLHLSTFSDISISCEILFPPRRQEPAPPPGMKIWRFFTPSATGGEFISNAIFWEGRTRRTARRKEACEISLSRIRQDRDDGVSGKLPAFRQP